MKVSVVLMKRRRSRTYEIGSKPILKISRSKFDLSHHVKSMFNAGSLIPFYVQEIYPGDTFKIRSTNVCRTTSPFIRPVMDNMFLDMFYFFVPNRLVYDKWQNVMGQNDSGYWAPTELPFVPMVQGEVVKNSIGDYLGLPPGEYDKAVSCMPFRGYALIWNEWFRDENTQAPVLINTGDLNASDVLNGNAWGVNNGVYGMPAPVNKLHDYFTSCLPAPQKGSPVEIPLGMFAPVYPEDDSNVAYPSYPRDPLRMVSGNDGSSAGNYDLRTSPSGNLYGVSTSNEVGLGNIVPSNLVADLRNATAFNVNDLRFAFQLQKMLERDARSGTRYTELLQSHFGVFSSDSRLQRPEFLGGKRMPLSIQQVNQTSQSSSESPLAQVGAYSLSNGVCGCNKSFVEHGFIIGVMCVRQFHTYQQGVERFWYREKRTDFYDPVFANIGEQPVYTREIFRDNTEANTTSIFGYQEAFADLRYRPSRITGSLRSSSNEGFDIWTFADYYSSPPVLSDAFIRETPIFIDRCLSVPSTTAPQFIIDIYNKVDAIRPLPTYSIPGLIDHH